MKPPLNELEKRVERLELRDCRAKVLRLEKDFRRLAAMLQAGTVPPPANGLGGLRLVKGGAS